MCEFRSKISPRRDFQKDLWKIYTWQSCIHSLPKIHQTVRLIEFIKCGYDQIILPIHLLYAGAWIRRQVLS